MKYAMESAAPKKRNGNRRNAVRLGLAGIAVAGIGAALTSAAWTDEVWFTGPAQGAEFKLTASLTENGTFRAAPEGNPVTLPAFEKLVPGDERVVHVYVKNEGNVDATLVATPSVEGFTGDEKITVTAVVPNDDTVLEPNDVATVTVTLTVPDGWAEANKGETGTVKLVVEGTS